MPFNRAIIPLYLNADMLNNLFSIVVQEFVEIRSMSTKNQVMMHLKTPVSEFSYDLFGKYMQGEFDIQISNEYIKQRTEEKISTLIIILKKLRDLLLAQGLLKGYNSPIAMTDLKENDFLEFGCQLKRNPVIQNVLNAIGVLQAGDMVQEEAMENAIDSTLNNGIFNSNFKKSEMLNFLKNSLDDHKKDHCLRYVAHNIDDTDSTAVIPLKTASFLDNEDYLLNGKVRILGKVVRTFNNNYNEEAFHDEKVIRHDHPLYNDSFFDYLDFNKINQFNIPFLREKPSLYNFDYRGENLNPSFELLPIAVYI